MELRKIKKETRLIGEEKNQLFEYIDAMNALLSEKESLFRTREIARQLEIKLNE